MENKTENTPVQDQLLTAEQVAVLVQEKGLLQEEVVKLKFELSRLQRYLFGSARERFIPTDPNQPTLFQLPEPTVQVEPTVIRVAEHTKTTDKTTEKSGHGRGFLPSHLRRVYEVREPDFVPEGAVRIGEEITEMYEFRGASVYVRQIIRPKYALPEGDGVLIAKTEQTAMPKSSAGPSIVAHILVSKYVDHLPYYRIAKILLRQGASIAESTINDWFMAASKALKPLYDVLERKIVTNAYLMADETTIKVLESDKEGSTHQGYFWVYYSPPLKTICYKYQTGRSKKYPVEFLKNFEGALQTDGYAGYEELGVREGIVHLACMAHARRKFFEAQENDLARSAVALEMFAKLYKIESHCRNAGFEAQARHAYRVEHAKPVLTELHNWLRTEVMNATPKSPMGKAISYTLKLWHRLSRYVDNGVWEIDNNLVENKMRPIALGRKNYLFCGNHESAQNAAMMYTFFESCKGAGIDPTKWLTYVLDVIVDTKPSQYEELLPSTNMIIPDYHSMFSSTNPNSKTTAESKVV